MTGIAIVLGLNILGPQLRSVVHALRIARRLSVVFRRTKSNRQGQESTMNRKFTIAQ
jgi:hypothetical protein